MFRPPGCIFALFRSFFILAGGLFFVFALFMVANMEDTKDWIAVPATIESLEIDYPREAPNQSKGAFELQAKFIYEYEGKRQQGATLTRQPSRSDDYESLADHRAKLIRDEIQHAFVNPEDPTEAILERNRFGAVAFLGLGVFLLVPLAFMVFGGVFAASGLGYLDPTKFNAQYSGRGLGWLFFTLFGSIFTMAGIGSCYFLVLKPYQRATAARTWEETPATVIWSRVLEHEDDDPHEPGEDTYSVDIFFEYEFDDEVYRSNRYSFMNTSTNDYRSYSKIANRYPSGKTFKCFVDPATPRHAVIKRDASQIGFWVLFPLPFLLIGLTCLIGGLRSKFGGL